MVKRATSLMLLFCLLIVGCAHSQEPRIVGNWACKESGDRLELSKDHTCTVYSMGFQYSGRWIMSKSDIMVEAGQIVLKGNFDGKNITVEDAVMHNKYTFEKVVQTQK